MYMYIERFMASLTSAWCSWQREASSLQHSRTFFPLEPSLQRPLFAARVAFTLTAHAAPQKHGTLFSGL